MQVTMVDGEGGNHGAKIDRVIRSLQDSESDCMLLCTVQKQITTTTGGGAVYANFDDLSTSDDFSSISQQFRLFRVAHIKFDVYDINPANTVVSIFGTHHGVNLTGFTFENVVDLPDSRVVPPGSGKSSFYWNASSLQEREFQGTTTFVNYGGLVSFIDGQTTPTRKFSVIAKFVVHFRGRV